VKALFFVPPVGLSPVGLPVDRVYGCNYGYDYKPPIHFLQLATVAKVWLGWDVRFVDCPAEGLDVAAFENPRRTDTRKAQLDIAMEGGVAPGAGSIIDPDGLIRSRCASGPGSIGEFHLAHRHKEVRPGPRHVNTRRVRESGRFVVGDHGK